MHTIIGLVLLGILLLLAVFMAQLFITLAVMVIMAPFAAIQALYHKLKN